MDSITFSLLLDYLYGRFAVTFILSLIGVSIRELLRIIMAEEGGVHRKISVPKLVISTVMCTVVMCALADFINITFSVYVLLNIFVGMWSEVVVSFALNKVLVTRVFITLIKTIGPIGAAISESIKKALDDEDKSNEDGSENRNGESTSGRQ